MVKLLVVGAGVGGSMVAREARARGWTVTVAADSRLPPASKAALCVICPSWFTGELRRTSVEAIKVYAALDAVTAAAATYTRWDRPGLSRRSGMWGVDPAKVLVPPDAELTWNDERPDGFDMVVLCQGAYAPRAGARTWGVTTVVEGGEPGLRAHLTGPRHLAFAVNHGSSTRVGSSVSWTEAGAHQQQERLLDKVRHLVPAGDSRIIEGVRLMPHADTPGVIRRVADGVWSLDEFGRVGFSVAPTRAAQVLARAIK